MRVEALETVSESRVQALPYIRNSGNGTLSVVVPRSARSDAYVHATVGADFATSVHLGPSVVPDFARRRTWPVNRKSCDDPRLDDPVALFRGQSHGPVFRQAATNASPVSLVGTGLRLHASLLLRLSQQ
jgi:hypothetical protein